VCELDGRWFVFGGETDVGVCDEVSHYGVCGSWKSVAALPIAVTQPMTVVTLRGRIYVLGKFFCFIMLHILNFCIRFSVVCLSSTRLSYLFVIENPGLEHCNGKIEDDRGVKKTLRGWAAPRVAYLDF